MVNCPMKNETYTGYCDGCNERTDCMLRDVLLKLKELDLKLEQMQSVKAQR